MSKVDLTSLEWCELIFKDRNKSYGAYKMRRDFGETTGCSLDYRHCCGFGRIYLTASYQNGYAGSKRRNGRSDTAFHTGRAGNKRRNDEKGRTYRPSSSGS